MRLLCELVYSASLKYSSLFYIFQNYLVCEIDSEVLRTNSLKLRADIDMV